VDCLLDKGVDPNAKAAHGVPGSVPGTTPAVFLAATRGYFMVIELFKKSGKTNFLVENKVRLLGNLPQD